MKYDVITIGSATKDAFIETDDAAVVSVSRKDRKSEFMSYPYGSKIEINDFDVALGGGAVNTACNFANLGMKTATIIKIGNDSTGKDITKLSDISVYYKNKWEPIDDIPREELKSGKVRKIRWKASGTGRTSLC